MQWVKDILYSEVKMDYPISKRAGLMDAANEFLETVIDRNAGPFENAFKIIPLMTIPLLGSLGKIAGFILTNLALRILGISPREIGREIDEAFGWGPGDDPRGPGIMDQVAKFLANLFASLFAKKSAASNEYYISKRAINFVLMGKILAKAAYYLITMASSVFVFSKLEEFTEEHISGPAREQVSEWAEPEQEVGIPGDVRPEPKEESVDELADYIEQKYGLK
jgi:hypothetical protein